MARRYCSRCLQTFGSKEDPARCRRPACRRPRPEGGWPRFLGLGDVIDERYSVEEILGAGGAGITYRCSDRERSEAVAIKVLHGDRCHGVLVERLAIEGEVLELLDHPHVVPFRALELNADGGAYLITPHMEGGSLDVWLRKHGALPPRPSVVLGRQLALALDYVHAGGIVHRDIKPANVLLQTDDPNTLHARLADFGIARLFGDSRPLPELTRTGAFIGTPEYAAPEQKRGEKGVGPAADAFALGALLHAAASGTPLHCREDLADWEEFRFRTWNPEERPRLTDLSDARGRDLADLNQLDEVIDALMQPDAAARIDMGHAALRLGANPNELAPRDLPAFSPPSLVSGTDGWFGGDEFDALLPADTPAAPAPLSHEGPTLLIPRHVSPAADREPRLDLPIAVVITRDTASDWDEEEFDWARRRRQNRRHGLLALVAALLLGSALAWPGGPGALLEQTKLASIAAPLQDLAHRLRLEEPTPSPEAPPRGRVVQQEAPAPAVLTSSMASGLSRRSPRESTARIVPKTRSPGPARDATAPTRDATAPTRDATAPTRDATGPTAAPKTRAGEVSGRARKPHAEPRKTKSHPTNASLAELIALARERNKAASAGEEPGSPAAYPQNPHVEPNEADPRTTYSETLRRQREAADRRAAAYDAEARAQKERSDQLIARIKAMQDRPTPHHSYASDSPNDEAPALDPAFLRAPRLRPQPDDVACE